MERPIMFVAHSLGGIVVKSALIHSDAARHGALEERRSIKVSTYGIIFMGTPHQGGSGVQLGKLLVNIASLFVAADDRLLRHLQRDSEWLQQQLGQYGPISGDFVTKFAFEEYKTPTALGHSIMVVPRASAVVPGQANAEPIAIHADHKDMVRYTSRQDSGYKAMSEHLQIMSNAAPEEVRRRWETEIFVDEVRLGSFAAPFKIVFSLSEVSDVDHFVARGEELAKLHKVPGEDTGRRTAVVHGLGGMGKTQLAAAYAKHHRDNYSAVFWLNVRDETSLRQSMARIAKQILREHPSAVYVKNAVESRSPDEAVETVKRWLDQPKNDGWLMIYDNYDNPKLEGDGNVEHSEGLDQEREGYEDAIATEAYDIKPFLPNAYHGAILITTRSSRVRGRRIPLGKLRDLGDSLEILSHTSGREGLHKDADAVELAEELDGLPLALSTAGAYLDNTTTTFADYLQLYRKSWLRLQTTTPALPSYDWALYSTWDISYKQVERKNYISAMLLRLWAYFDHEDIWYELLREGHFSGPPWFQTLTSDALGFNEAVRVLFVYGLVEPNTSGRERGVESSGYSIHGCVHSWTVHVLNKVQDVDLARLAMRCVGSHVPSHTEREYWVIQRRLTQHASRCLAMVLLDESIADWECSTLYSLGYLFADQGRLNEAEAMYKRALLGKEKVLGAEHTSTLNTVNNLGILYIVQGRFNEAEAMYERALQGYEKVLGVEHSSTLNTVKNLGILYKDQGRLSEAEAMYERALQGYEKVLGPDQITRYMPALNTIGNLAYLCTLLSKASEARALYLRYQAGLRLMYGLQHERYRRVTLALASLESTELVRQGT